MAQLKSTNIVGNLSVTGNILASKIIKLGGTSTQILMADGSTMNAPSAGLGTVTSVGVSSSSLTVTGSPITSSGTITIEHPTATATTADIYKIGKDNQGHVVIGAKITPADLGLSKVYKYKGTKTWTELLALTKAEIGDVYSITNKDPDGNTNADWACCKAVSAACTTSNYSTYWQSLGGKVDLSAYVQGPSSATDNAIARFDTTTGKLIQNSSVSIDDSGNVVPATTAASELGSSSIAWKRAYIHQLDLYREKGNNYGRISFYKPTMYTWFEYMSPDGVASPTGANTVQYGEVTSWARRSLIEPNSGYGWTWEAASNSANAAVSGIMALSSTTGNLKVKGSVTANGFKHSDATKGNNSYVLLAGGDAKSLTEFITSDGTKVKANQVFFHKDLKFTKTFGNYIPDSTGSITIPTLTESMSLHDLLEKAFSSEQNPVVDTPSVSFSVTGNKTGEVGTTFSMPTATLTVSNVGSYTYGPATGIVFKSGNMTITQSNNTANKASNSSNLVAGGSFSLTAQRVDNGNKKGNVYREDPISYTFTATAKYTTNPANIPVTNLGNPVPSLRIGSDSAAAKDVPITISSKTTKYTGYRKMFWGTLTNTTTALNSDTIRGLTGVSTEASTTSKKTLIIPAGVKRTVIAVPSKYSLSQVLDVNDSQANITGSFVTTTASVEGANDYPGITYNVYYIDYANATKVSNQYYVTISS